MFNFPTFSVERTTSRPHQFRRLRVKYEPRAGINETFLALGYICFNFMSNFR